MQSRTKPWLLLLLTAPVPLILFGILSFQWYRKQTDSTRIMHQFIQRQNSVIGMDAKNVATQFTHLLLQGVRVARALPALKNDIQSRRILLKSFRQPITEWNPRSRSIETNMRGLFTEISEWNLSLSETVRTNESGLLPTRNGHNCDVRNHCDLALLEALVASPKNTLRIGSIVRWYTPEGMEDSNEGSSLGFAVRTENRIHVASLDYAHLKHFLLANTFPYERRGDPIEGYLSGNYVYVTDANHNVIAHPKYWHVYGFDRTTGKAIPPMTKDSESGTHPLNIAAYREGVLRQYFDHLMNQSFRLRTPDVFSAVNLKGTLRILASAPIFLKEGQFQEDGIFGHVITGCNIDYYSNPKEQKVPYY